MSLTSTTYPTTVDYQAGNAAFTRIKTFLASAATSYSRGDLVTINTDGSVAKNTTNGGVVDGVVYTNVDNSLGILGTKTVPVVVQGNIWADAYIEASGTTFGTTFTIGVTAGPYGDAGTTVANGQGLNASSTGGKIFTSLIVQGVSPSKQLVKGMFYFQGSGKF